MAEIETVPSFGMTDLSEALRSSGGDELRKSILARFGQLENDLSASLATGLSPADYAGAEKLRAAFSAAREIVVHFR